MSTHTGKIPLSQKIIFGIGMFANQMFPAILGIFMVVLVQDLGFPGWMWALIFFGPRIFDSITDPIMGFISDNTKSKWGRRRQYVLLGGIIMGIAFIFMWQLYKANSLQYNFWYFFLWSLVFYLGLTIFSVPYVAMGYEMTDDFHERTNLMATAQWIGQWAWVIAPWFWIIMYDKDWFPSAEVATRTLAIWVAIPCALAAITPALFIKSNSTLDEDYEPLNFQNIGGSLLKIFSGFVDAFSIKPFVKICAATFLIFNAFNTVASLTFFVIVYKLFNGDPGATGVWVALFGSIGALFTTFIVIPTVAWLSRKVGKKKAFFISQSISIIGYIMLYFLFVPGKPWLYIFALPFFSFGIGSLFTIMMSMTADVIDIDELKSGLRREGIFGAIYWWMVKVGFAFAGGLSGLIITVVGFVENVPTVDQQGAVDNLHAFFCFFPAAGTILALIIMSTYSVTEEKSNEIRKQLDARKKNKKPQSSSYYEPNAGLTAAVAAVPLATSFDLNLSQKSEQLLHSIFTDTLEQGLYGLSFSPYVEGQELGDILSETQIRKRMSVIKPYIKWVRSFSSTDGNNLIPRKAKREGLNTMAGAWIDGNKDKNELEIKALLQSVKEGDVDIAAVGNEVLLRNDLSVETLIEYIQKVKKEIPDVAITYVDTYHQYYGNPQLFDVADKIAINVYPFWEGDSVENALDKLRKVYQLMTEMAGDKEVIIAETGWPSEGESMNDAVPSKRNAAQYFIEVQNWAQKENIPLFYFSSFDESWKIRTEGQLGARWGIWNSDEKLKY